MVLVKRIEKSGTTVLVFEGNDEGKTVERILAETICRLAPNGGPVDSWAIHFASIHHPFSTTQRLREMSKLWDKFWTQQQAPNIESKGYAPAYYFVKKEFKYYFNPEFAKWVRNTYLHQYYEPEPADVPAR